MNPTILATDLAAAAKKAGGDTKKFTVITATSNKAQLTNITIEFVGLGKADVMEILDDNGVTITMITEGGVDGVIDGVPIFATC